MDTLLPFTIALLGGVIPTFIWLYFWLQEDGKYPEPKRNIIRCFVFGMLAVPVAAITQYIWNEFFINNASVEFLFQRHYLIAIITLVIWSAVEELFKFIGALKGGLSTKDNNEPIDSVVYMITAALGFAALENTYYLFNSIMKGYDFAHILVVGNNRFIGATLLHIASSAIIGIFMAIAYYKNQEIKKRYLVTGIVLSITLHTIFNSFMIRSQLVQSNKFALLAFLLVWLMILYIILMFEKIKKTIKNK